MTAEQLIDEIKKLDEQIAAFQRDIILADGARQAFRYMLDKLVVANPVDSTDTSEVSEVKND